MNPNFITVYCRQYAVSADEFFRSLLSKSTRIHIRPMLLILVALRPKIFEQDFEYLEPLKKATSRQEFRAELGCLDSYYRFGLPLWRRKLGLRLSIGRLSRFSRLLH